MAVEAFADVGHGVFEAEFVDADRVRRREALSAVWTERFESLPLVRKVRTYGGQRSVTREYWSTTMRKPLACESRLERDYAMLMDFDPQVTGLVSQPFRLFWPTRRGRLGHVPDFFARLADGTGVVVDVRPDDQIEPDDAQAFAATERVCELAGWSFRRVGVISPVLLANVRWPRGYGHPGAGGRRRPGGCWRCSPSHGCCSPGRRRPGTGSRCCRCSTTCSGEGCWSRMWSRRSWGRNAWSGGHGRGGEAVMMRNPLVVRPGDRVRFDGKVQTVAGLSGMLVRLADDAGGTRDYVRFPHTGGKVDQPASDWD